MPVFFGLVVQGSYLTHIGVILLYGPLFSREGITQGDPLLMLFYAVALLPLIRLLKSSHYTVMVC